MMETAYNKMIPSFEVGTMGRERVVLAWWDRKEWLTLALELLDMAVWYGTFELAILANLFLLGD